MYERNQNSMSEEKRKRIFVSLIIGAVLLLVILLGVMIYQMVSIFALKKRKANYEKMVEYYMQLTDEERERIEACKLEDYIKLEARKLGYKDPTDLD